MTREEYRDLKRVKNNIRNIAFRVNSSFPGYIIRRDPKITKKTPKRTSHLNNLLLSSTKINMERKKVSKAIKGLTRNETITGPKINIETTKRICARESSKGM